VKWESEAFQQIHGDYGVRGIPYLRIYGTDGEFLGDVSGGNLRAIRDLISGQAKKK
jgi:hypothetical protein